MLYFYWGEIELFLKTYYLDELENKNASPFREPLPSMSLNPLLARHYTTPCPKVSPVPPPAKAIIAEIDSADVWHGQRSIIDYMLPWTKRE